MCDFSIKLIAWIDRELPDSCNTFILLTMTIIFLGIAGESCSCDQSRREEKDQGEPSPREIFADDSSGQIRFCHGVPHFRL
jgi:hypothetical protein